MTKFDPKKVTKETDMGLNQTIQSDELERSKSIEKNEDFEISTNFKRSPESPIDIEPKIFVLNENNITEFDQQQVIINGKNIKIKHSKTIDKEIQFLDQNSNIPMNLGN